MAVTTWLAEMKRRRVFRTLVGYGIFSFGVLQVVEPIMHGLSLPDWVLTVTVIGLGLGFPIALVLAWAFDINDGRIERSGPFPTARLLLLLIAGGLALGAPGVVWHFWRLRPQTEAADSLPAPATAAARAPASRSIAVLPFVNMSADPENDFFADGLSEEILNSLARIDGLQVVGRTSSFQFKGKPADLRAVGSRLGAAHVLEGSVRKSGERARITAQLIRVADGFHAWSQTYDRTLTDVLAVQLDIADHVAGALDVLLDEAQRARLLRSGVKSVDAFVAFQKGEKLFQEAHWNNKSHGKVELLRQANEEFAHATALEPEFAKAWFESADLHMHVLISASSSDEERTLALQSARRALALAFEHVHEPAQRLFIEVNRQLVSDDWSGLKGRLEAAYAASGCGVSDFTEWMMQLGVVFGFAPQTQALSRRLMACDPLDPDNDRTAMEASNWAGQPEETLVLMTGANESVGSSRASTLDAARAYAALGRFDEARALLAAVDEGEPVIAIARLVIEAAAGADAEAVDARLKAAHPEHAARDGWSVVDWTAAALARDRAEANRLSALFDARAGGPLRLALLTGRCECGAPFDLDATPNFKARIAESGLPWPPPTPIRFPQRTARRK